MEQRCIRSIDALKDELLANGLIDGVQVLETSPGLAAVTRALKIMVAWKEAKLRQLG